MIDACYVCSEFYYPVFVDGRFITSKCMHPEREGEMIPDDSTIPDWCPLEDADVAG